jgi:uncharacterized membrane protein (UPF0127 family)
MVGQIWARGAVRCRAWNVNNGRLIADRVGLADRAIGRVAGLSRLDPGDALWIAPSRAVHTCGVRFAIDLFALDRDGRIVDVSRELRPWRAWWPSGAVAGVLETPAGTLEASGARIGDAVVFEIVRDVCHERDHAAA